MSGSCTSLKEHVERAMEVAATLCDTIEDTQAIVEDEVRAYVLTHQDYIENGPGD